MKASVLALAACLCAVCGRAERIELVHKDARCVVETQGARVVSYAVGGQELVWMPEQAAADVQAWQHGGIPLAWPWFGRIGRGDADIHGYAWKRPFAVVSRKRDAVVLELKTGSAALEYAVTLGEKLVLELRTRNTSEVDFPVGVAFHPYFRVGERDATVVEGVFEQPVCVTNAVDRSVRFETPKPHYACVIRDRTRGLALRVEAENATGVNLWNPGVEKKCPGEIPGDAWRRFVAVEPFSMGVNRFWALPPGETHVLKMTLAASVPSLSSVTTHPADSYFAIGTEAKTIVTAKPRASACAVSRAQPSAGG